MSIPRISATSSRRWVREAGYPVVSRILARRRRASDRARAFFRELADQLVATVHRVERLTPTIVEVVVVRRARRANFIRAVLSAAELRIARAAISGTRMQMEGLAMTGAWVDRDQGLVSSSFSRWAARAICARCCSPASPSS
jgi:hypothetical protein